MPTPDGLNTTTIHGKYVEPNPAGTPLQGTLTFTPNPATITFPTQNVIVAGTETATLDSNGEFTIELISTDQGGENPTGWTYSVGEKLVNQKPRSYIIALPYNGGVTIELSDITPTDAAPNYVPVVGPQGAPGIVTTVNGHSSAVITLSAADVDAVDILEVGAPSGVASLDAGGKVPIGQIPSLSATYVPWANVEIANGVASLDASGKVKATELNLASATPTAIATAGAVGTSTNLAREDHTHAGMNLTSAQSVGGVKTFTSGTQLLQLGVGVAPGTQRAHIVSTVDETGLQVEQVTLTGTNALISAVGFDNSMVAFGARVNGDTVGRIALKTSGNIEFGSGSGARDTTFYRSSTGNLNSNQFNADAAAPTAISHLTRKDYVDAADALAVHLAGTETVTGVKTFNAGTTFSRSAAANTALQALVTGDTQPRLNVGADGKLSWGPGGSTVTDTTFYRSAAGMVKTDQSLTVTNQLIVGTSGLYVIQDWQNLSAVGSFATNASAGGQVPRIRKIMLFGREIWELEGQIAFNASWSSGAMFTFTGGATSPYTPSTEHDFSIVPGVGSSTSSVSLRAYWSTSGNMGISPGPVGGAGTLNNVYLEQIRIINPLQV